ncbi:hypothetical protein B0H14DRAFT_3145954 [Mycena olivaceomarginata]|nr:hypothetical protein B0H14DRAFT_3145954 [Mycena olivaceomarginata]
MLSASASAAVLSGSPMTWAAASVSAAVLHQLRHARAETHEAGASAGAGRRHVHAHGHEHGHVEHERWAANAIRGRNEHAAMRSVHIAIPRWLADCLAAVFQLLRSPLLSPEGWPNVSSSPRRIGASDITDAGTYKPMHEAMIAKLASLPAARGQHFLRPRGFTLFSIYPN